MSNFEKTKKVFSEKNSFSLSEHNAQNSFWVLILLLLRFFLRIFNVQNSFGDFWKLWIFTFFFEKCGYWTCSENSSFRFLVV